MGEPNDDTVNGCDGTSDADKVAVVIVTVAETVAANVVDEDATAVTETAADDEAVTPVVDDAVTADEVDAVAAAVTVVVTAADDEAVVSGVIELDAVRNIWKYAATVRFVMILDATPSSLASQE